MWFPFLLSAPEICQYFSLWGVRDTDFMLLGCVTRLSIFWLVFLTYGGSSVVSASSRGGSGAGLRSRAYW